MVQFPLEEGDRASRIIYDVAKIIEAGRKFPKFEQGEGQERTRIYVSIARDVFGLRYAPLTPKTTSARPKLHRLISRSKTSKRIN